MQEDSALIAVAEIAVAIAGFSGIAMALQDRGNRGWNQVDRDRFSDLVAQSGIALFASLVPLVFAYRSGLGPNLWVISSQFWAGFATLGVGLSLLRTYRRGGSVFGLVSAATTLGFGGLIVLQLYNWLVLAEFWPYFAGLVANLGLAFVQFMGLAIPRVRE